MTLFPALVAALLQGCIYLPQTTNVYDQDCKIMAKHMTLKVQQFGVFGHCVSDGCVAVLVAIGAVSAASAVVSGSIVVAGNIVYWFEKQGLCLKQEKLAQP
jgi:hypothetical protein